MLGGVAGLNWVVVLVILQHVELKELNCVAFKLIVLNCGNVTLLTEQCQSKQTKYELPGG